MLSYNLIKYFWDIKYYSLEDVYAQVGRYISKEEFEYITDINYNAYK